MPYAFAIGQSNEKLVRGLFQCLSPLRSLSGKVCRDTILKVASTPPVQLAIPSFKLLPHVFYRCLGIEVYEREKQKDHMLKLNPDVSNISFFDFDQSLIDGNPGCNAACVRVVFPCCTELTLSESRVADSAQCSGRRPMAWDPACECCGHSSFLPLLPHDKVRILL